MKIGDELFMKFISWVKSISKAKQIGLLAGAVVVIAGVTVGGIFLINGNKSNEEPPKVVEVAEETNMEKPVEFQLLHIDTSSMEKDIDIFFLDENENKIEGKPFAVKLLTEENAKRLDTSVGDINSVNEEIKNTKEAIAKNEENSQAVQSSEVVSSSADNGESKASEQDNEAEKEESLEEKLVSLSKKKQEVIASYKSTLESIEGTSLSDDNMDGRITQKKMEPGDFVVCFVPVEDYEATEFATKTTIKDKVEYKYDKNVEKKVVSAEKAGDQNAHNTQVEATLQDTVPWIDSKEIPVPGVYKAVSAMNLRVSEGTAQSFSQGGATVNYNDNLVVYADGAGINSVSLRFNGTGVDNLRAESSKFSITNEGTGVKLVPIKSAFSGDGATNETVHIRGTITGAGGASVSSLAAIPFGLRADNNQIDITVTVKVYGYNYRLTDSNGRPLFVDGNGDEIATLKDYTASFSGYYEESAPSIKYYGWSTQNGIMYYYNQDGVRVTGTQVIKGSKYNFGSDGALLTSGTGIDVSKWQGSIDWSQVKSAVSFAIIRAGFRGRDNRDSIAVDPYAVTNIKGCNANGIRCGLYFYSIACTEAEAVEEASLAISIARKGSISLPIYIDMEDSTQLANTTKEERDAIVMAFCRTVQSAGYQAGVYANKNWLTNYLNPSSYGPISIWCAQYNTQNTYNGRYDIWQYTSDGSVPGINGIVDMNISYF